MLMGSPGILEVIQERQPLQKDEKGVWSLTLGPLPAGFCTYIAAFGGGGNRAEWEKADAAVLNKKLKVLWLGCGTDDFAYTGVKGMVDLLTSNNVKHVFNPCGGGHGWPNWQVYLSQYAPLLFRDQAQCGLNSPPFKIRSRISLVRAGHARPLSGVRLSCSDSIIGKASFAPPGI